MTTLPAPVNTCPGCSGLLAVTGKPHCKIAGCDWVKCRCGITTSTTTGRYIH